MEGAINSILSGLSELVYLCDVETYELVYLNETGQKAFHASEAKGEPCYRVLQGRDAPCPFCTNDKLGFDSFYEWDTTNEVTGRRYFLRDKLLNLDGRTLRLEIAFDVTGRQNEKDQFKFLADAGVVVIDCIKILETQPDLPKALDETLRRLGTFLEADRAYIFEVEGDSMSNTHEWCGLGVEPQLPDLQDMPLSLIDHWLARFEAGEAVLIDSVADLPEDRRDEHDVLAAQGISSLAAVPIEIDGRLAGYLGVDNPLHGNLGIIEMPLVGLAYFTSSSMKRAYVQKQLETLTWNDPLTGTHSRAAFHRDFDRGTFDRIGFALVDADRLSEINREEGRPAGDEMLRRIGSCLHEVFGDAVYRIGDDEFCAVALPLEYEEFDRMTRSLTARFAEAGLPASVGLAWSERCEDATVLLNTAGDRMRRVKIGRHRATDLGIDLAQDGAVNDLIRPGGARDAVEAGLLDIFLMPQVATQTGALVGAEALIRYLDPERGIEVQPASFVPALEDMGEIADVDFFALTRACETVARWQREGRAAVPIAVNFSRMTVGEEGFVDRVAETVARFGVDPSLIEIEVTESARGRGGDLLRCVADDLRGRGFSVAVDDFGVDNANVSLFVQLEFDVLKMDRSLIWGIDATDRTMRVVSGLASLCDDLSIESVAEGIETEQQLEALKTTGCTRAQGYLIGRPSAIDEFERRFMA